MNREQRRAEGKTTAPPPSSPACLACGSAELLSPDDPGDGGLRPGDVVICGLCATVHVLYAKRTLTDWTPALRRPVLEELEEIRARPAVGELLAAYELANMERRMRGAARKGPKVGKGLVLEPGGKLKLEGYGPDYRGPRLL